MQVKTDLLTLIRQLEGVGMAHEDVARYAYEHVLAWLYGNSYSISFPHFIPASTHLQAATMLVECFNQREIEKRNDSWLWKNLNRYCSASANGKYKLSPMGKDATTIELLTRWKMKGWINFDYEDGGYYASIVEPEVVSNAS